MRRTLEGYRDDMVTWKGRGEERQDEEDVRRISGRYGNMERKRKRRREEG